MLTVDLDGAISIPKGIRMSREESTSERLLREIGERDRRLKDVGGNKHLRAYQGAIEPPLTSRSLLRASRRLAPDPSAAMNYGAPRSNMAREARGGRSVAQAPRAELATHAAPEPLPGIVSRDDGLAFVGLVVHAKDDHRHGSATSVQLPTDRPVHYRPLRRSAAPRTSDDMPAKIREMSARTMNKTTPDSPARNASGHLTRPEVILGLGILVLAVVARFMPRSGLWLDEALSVNISTESLGDIGTRLRADGHPPLYYALLHFWTNLGGTGDWWVRALSGVISVIGIPLAWLAGRRLFESPESSLATRCR